MNGVYVISWTYSQIYMMNLFFVFCGAPMSFSGHTHNFIYDESFLCDV